MVEYGYRKVTLKNASSERYRLVFEVYDKSYRVLAAFINSEYLNFGEHIRKGLEGIKTGESESFDFSGNRIGMKVRDGMAVFEDEAEFGEEEDEYRGCEIPVSELLDIIDEWDMLRPAYV